MSVEHDIVLVVRDRSSACADEIILALDIAHLAAMLEPVLADDAVLCTDVSAALAAAARHIGIEHHAINASAGQHALESWHINNVDGYHSRLKPGCADSTAWHLPISATTSAGSRRWSDFGPPPSPPRRCWLWPSASDSVLTLRAWRPRLHMQHRRARLVTEMTR